MKRTLISAVAIAALTTGAAYAANYEFDADADGMVTMDEYANWSDGAAIQAAFTRIDADGNGMITPDEANIDVDDSRWEFVDDNADGTVTRDELASATFRNYDLDVNDGWDADEMKSYITEEEANYNIFDAEAPRTGGEVSQ